MEKKKPKVQTRRSKSYLRETKKYLQENRGKNKEGGSHLHPKIARVGPEAMKLIILWVWDRGKNIQAERNSSSII